MSIGIYPPIAAPYIVFKHIDGPYLKRRDGTIRWLTLRERFLVWIGKLSAWDLESRP